MQDGYIRAAAATPKLRVADPEYNWREMEKLMKEASEAGAKLLVFPELSICGYTCGDLFLQDRLIQASRDALFSLVRASAGMDTLVFAGLPWVFEGKLYNAACAFQDGRILAVIPKSYLPSYGEFYEARYFTGGAGETEYIPDEMDGSGSRRIPFGTDILLCCENIPELKVACEICEDAWVPYAPSNRHAVAGANVIVNLSASDAVSGKKDFRRQLIKAQTSRLMCAYVYASAGAGESTTDLVFCGHNMIAEAGDLLAERLSLSQGEGLCMTEIDLLRLAYERRRTSTFENRKAMHSDSGTYGFGTGEHEQVLFRILEEGERPLLREIDPSPFLPKGPGASEALEEMLLVQATGLKKRLEHIGAEHAVLGLSGGLDSTLALLVAGKAFRLMGLPAEKIICVTMPAFGTTDRTYQNACRLAKEMGASLREINIRESVLLHFRDIGHDPEDHNSVYENAQARERTQILMDIANGINGVLVGTGDMSEMALGWCTYNGDHMSMYAVNAGVPKTLVRCLVSEYAEKEAEGGLSAVLLDILDTPVSPELLPPDKEGDIAQKTEDLVGPYELHDFFLYQMLLRGFPPRRIYRMAKRAFRGTYSGAEILKWLRTFYRRFFSQQFKRSCSVDGPKVVAVDLSPRGSLRMPSDAVADAWLSELSELEKEA